MKKRTLRIQVLLGILFVLCFVSLLEVMFLGRKNIPEDISGASIVSVSSSVVRVPVPLLFVGDIMLGRYVEKRMNEYGGAYPFVQVRDLLKKHTVIANLEGPIPEVHEVTPAFGFRFSFPSRSASVLQSENIDAVTLANNHGFDMGKDGHSHTKKILSANEVVSFGSYDNTALDYYTTKLGTTSITVIGINMVSDMWNEKKVLDSVQKMVAEHDHSVVVAFLHWGNEYSHTQNSVQREFAHKLIDRGVGVIVGAHPHVTQGVEVYKGKPIFYSLGNFIFDQYFNDDVQESYGVEVQKFGDDLVFVALPFQSHRSQVSVATGTKADAIVDVIKRNSSAEVKKMFSGNELRIPISVMLNNQ